MERLEQLPIPLLEWYRDNARKLPWREDPTPYHVWISEIMLQQTRVTAVLPYYTRFMEEVPDVAALAGLPQERLMKLWQGLGYYSRARNLQTAAQQVMERHGGVFPADYDSIRALKGVGDYTAGAICSIAFGLPAPAVDGNVLRVVTRITGDSRDITVPAVKRDITEALRAVMPRNAAGDFTQALMELGATVCLPNGAPLCGRCPARTFCTARLEDRTAQLPVKAPKKARRVEQRTVWLIFFDHRVALRRRPERGLLAGLWEYPHEPGDLPPEDWGFTGPGEFGCTAKHIFSHIEWHMTARILRVETPDLPEGWVWASRQDLQERYAVPSAFEAMAHLVEQQLQKDQ